MDYTPIQDLVLADCRTLEGQLREMKLNYPKWQMPAYPEGVQNFANFRTAMEFKFSEANVLDVVKGISICLDVLPEDNDLNANQQHLHEFKIKLYKMKNAIIYGLLTNTFEKNHEGFAHIGAVEPGDGFTAWNNLLNYVATEIIESSGGSKSDFFNMKQLKTQSLVQFAKSIRDAAQVLCENGHEISENDCKEVLRKGFIDPSRDQTIRAAISILATNMSFVALQSNISTMIANYRSMHKETSIALNADKFHYCPGCQKAGVRHSLENCWSVHPELKRKRTFTQMSQNPTVQCFKCRGYGHYKRDCPNKFVVQQTPTSSNSTPTPMATNPSPDHGGSGGRGIRGGRFAPRDAGRGRGRGRGRFTGRGTPSAHFVDASNETDNVVNDSNEPYTNDYSYDDTAYMVYSSTALFVSDTIPVREGYIAWVLDSACTEHLTYDHNAFTKLRNSDHHIHVADSHTLHASGEGILSHFRTVYHYPTIMRNLLSEGALLDCGWTITYATDGTGDKFIQHPLLDIHSIRFQRIHRLWIGYTPLKTELIEFPTSDVESITDTTVDDIDDSSLFYINPSVSDIMDNTLLSISTVFSDAQSLVAYVQRSSPSTVLSSCDTSSWGNLSPAVTAFLMLHLLLAHMAYRTLYDALARGTLVGFPFPLSAIRLSELPACEVDRLTKSHVAPRSNKPRWRPDNPGAMWHSDIKGPFRVKSIRGYYYWITFIDDYSGFTFLYFLRFKSDALVCGLKRFVAEVLVPYGIQSCILVHDPGGEYDSTAFQTYCYASGILLNQHRRRIRTTMEWLRTRTKLWRLVFAQLVVMLSYLLICGVVSPRLSMICSTFLLKHLQIILLPFIVGMVFIHL